LFYEVNAYKHYTSTGGYIMLFQKNGLAKGAVLLLALLMVISTPVWSGGTKEKADEGTAQSVQPGGVAQESGSIVFRVSTPPDPNLIPLAVLRAKAEEWMPGVEVEIVTAPAGDPGAMRAMIQKKSVDFALFNSIGGSKFYSAGLDNLRMMGVHVWKGVYLLAREDIRDLDELNGKTLASVPAVQTPPHQVSMKALRKNGVEAEFVPGGSGPSLMALLSRPDKAPAGFVAPEPMVSIILARQEKDNWPVKYRVFLDPQKELNPDSSEIPLGALWLLKPELVSEKGEAVRAFVEGFDRAAEYVNDPRHQEEVAGFVSEVMGEIFGQNIGPQVYMQMLSSGRLGLDFRGAEVIEEEVSRAFKKLYDFEVDPGMFCRGL
jgi:ABC-type nitrate/sulfonate/bicarbonate transport system substrate-binding protein